MPCLGEVGLRLGKPEGSPAGEVLSRLGKEKLRIGKVVRLSKGVLRLGKPEIAAKCCFSCCTVFCVGRLFGRAPSTKVALSGYVK